MARSTAPAPAANGIVWSSDWVPGAPFGSLSDTFASEYKAAYGGKVPSNWAAEAYDAVWFAARAMKQAGSTDPTKLQAALTSVGNAGLHRGARQDQGNRRPGKHHSAARAMGERPGGAAHQPESIACAELNHR